MIVSTTASVTPQETQNLTDKVRDKSGGLVTITQDQPYGRLGSGSDLMWVLSTGLVNIASPAEARADPWLPFYKLPYFPESPDINMYKTFAAAQSLMIEDLYNQNGIKLLTHQGMPSDLSRLLLLTKAPVKSIKDLRGMMIHVDTREQIALVEALGARAVSISMSDLWMALWRGVIDGAIMSPLVAKSYSIDEACQYSIGLWPTMTVTYYGVNRVAFDMMSKYVQSALVECFDEYSNKSWESVKPGEAEKIWEVLEKEKGLFYTKSFPPEEQAELIEIAKLSWAGEIEAPGPIGKEWQDFYERITGIKIRVNPWLIATITIIMAAIFAFVTRQAIKAHRRQPHTGEEGLIGKTGIVKVALEPTGTVLLEGELWTAILDGGRAQPGEKVIITKVERLKLFVNKI